VRPQPILLVDHAEADAGVTPIEVGEHLEQRRAFGLDLRSLLGVREQGGRDANPHRERGAAVTE
jgi:hypothetical protein